MELVEGPTLADLITGKKLALDEAIRIARQVADPSRRLPDHTIAPRATLTPGTSLTPPEQGQERLVWRKHRG
jgi:hypothetical protein